MATIASIDFSINSTCITVLSEGRYHWHHFGREKTTYFDLNVDGFTRYLFPKRVKGSDYCQTERARMEDARIFCSTISNVLMENEVSAVAFEGHSFNSKGNSLLELVSYQFLLRNLISSLSNMSIDRMFFYSPTTIKAFAGGARFKKKDMLERFVESKDERLKESKVFQRISKSLETIIKGEDVAKPVDDLVDSYWILKKLEQDV